MARMWGGVPLTAVHDHYTFSFLIQNCENGNHWTRTFSAYDCGLSFQGHFTMWSIWNGYPGTVMPWVRRFFTLHSRTVEKHIVSLNILFVNFLGRKRINLGDCCPQAPWLIALKHERIVDLDLSAASPDLNMTRPDLTQQKCWPDLVTRWPTDPFPTLSHTFCCLRLQNMIRSAVSPATLNYRPTVTVLVPGTILCSLVSLALASIE